MPTDLTFTEEWLRDYERRTGKHAHEQNGGPLPPAEGGEKRRSTRRAELPVLIEDRPNDNHNRHARADAVGLPA